jgi:hypothetical protein
MSVPGFRNIFFLFILFIFTSEKLFSQPWEFEKEVDGIRIYTRKEVNSPLKCYKGEVIIHVPMEKICAMVGNSKNFDWWGDDFKCIRVLSYADKKFVRYYYIYDMPWPLTDRDLAVEATVQTDTETGKYVVLSKPLLNVVPLNPDLVRINSYWQTWTMIPMGKGNVHVILEGFVDPGGNVPDWLYNMLTTEMPLKTIGLLRSRVLSPKPANK